MEIKKLLVNKLNTAKIVWLEESSEIRINQFVSCVGTPSDYPQVIIQEYKNHFKSIDKEWTSIVSHNILHGKKSKRIFLQSVGKFHIDTFIEDKLKFKIHHSKGSHVRMKYSDYNYFELSKMQVAMLFYKYGDELMQFELRIALIELLLCYFQLYTEHDDYEPFPKREWIIEAGKIEKCLESILNLSTEDIKAYMDYIDPNYRIQIKNRFDTDTIKHHHIPQNKEELMKVVKDGMSQTEIAEAIQDFWGVGDRTARNWMKRFGMTRKYRLNNQITDNTDATNTLLVGAEQTVINNQKFNSLFQGTTGQDTQIHQLLSQLNALANENQKLKEENVRLKSVAENPSMLIEKNRVLGLNNESLNKKVKELEEKIKSILGNTPKDT